jgi:aminopeptidase YwaD
MNRLRILLLFILPITAVAQDSTLVKNFKQHIVALSSDAMEGRETGMPGEKMAYTYIMNQFEKLGLEKKGTKDYLQAFPFTKSIKAGPGNELKINGASFVSGKHFYPLAYAANAAASGDVVRVGYGIAAPQLGYDDYASLKSLKGKVFLMQLGTPDNAGPHSKYASVADLRTRIDSAIAKGATAVIFVNSGDSTDNPSQEYRNRITASSVPVIFAKDEAKDLLMKGSKWKADIKTELVHDEGTGHNVIGFIDNKAQYTVVIGAHYDHLGYGHDELSLHRGERAIHNGADDNASGVAAMIELARYYKTGADKSNNYLFIGFSGEEKGLLGSNYFAKNPTVPLDQINYMINMDMLGRLKKDDAVLIINGAGTSSAWKITFGYIKTDGYKLKTSDSGIGPSDHTSFYLKDIPALHFFSGTHGDYHKPSDDEHLINYEGLEKIYIFIKDLVHRLDDKGKLDFVKTKDESNDDAPRFKVTLGVIPDYAYDGKGMRIDGITEGKPAANAGLKQGDIVIQLGDVNVVDMMSYMKALGQFKKGETTKVKVMRDKEELVKDITF